jgi:hypothetical protein
MAEGKATNMAAKPPHKSPDKFWPDRFLDMVRHLFL